MEPWNYLIVPLFVLAALACGATAVVSYRYGRNRGSHDPKVWAMFTVIFLVFVVVKAQRAIEILGIAARQEAHAGGLYDQRHPFQVIAVAGTTLLALLQAGYFYSYIAQRWHRYRWPLMGTGTIISFGILRAVSLHELDALGSWMQVAKVLVESLAAPAVIYGAALRIRHLRSVARDAAHGERA
jgi:hypothetical protein